MRKAFMVFAFAAVVGVLFSTTAFGASASWLDQAWSSRQGVIITNSTSTVLTNFQVKITLDSSFAFSSAQSDGSDIRVTTSDGMTIIPFWIETWLPGAQQGSIWVNVPLLSLGETTVFLYYGNPNPGSPLASPPTGPFTRAAGNPIVPLGDPNLGQQRGGENIVYDASTGHYWMVFTNYSIFGVGLMWSDTPTDPASWHWYGNVYNNPNNNPGSFAPCLVHYNGTWYIFFSDFSNPVTAQHNIVVISAPTPTGPYSAPIVMLSPVIGTWEANRVDEPYVFQRNDGKWIMLYGGDSSGYNTPFLQIGYAIADNILGPYTKYAGNPILPFGPPGSFDAGLLADPWAFEFNGTYYIGYSFSPDRQWPDRSAYATTTDWQTFTKQGILLDSSAFSWEAKSCFMGAITRIGDTYVYSYVGGPGVNLQLQTAIATQPVFTTSSDIINNPDRVFDFYDGFDGTALDGSKWSFANGSASQAVEAGGQLTLTATSSSHVRITSLRSFGMDYIVEAWARHPQQGTLKMSASVGLMDAYFGDTVRITGGYPSSLPGTWNRQAKLYGQPDVNWFAMAEAADQQWHTFTVYRQSPNVAGFQVDLNPVETVSSNVPTSNLPVLLMSYTEGFDNELVVDWIAVRKFINPQPVVALAPVAAPVPTIASLIPASATAGGAGFTLTVNGTDFVTGSVVQWNGSNRPTTYVSSTQMTAAISAADITAAGTSQVTVFSPAPGGGTSNAQTFTSNNPVPTIMSLSPVSATTGGPAFTLTANGTGFINGSVIQWNGASRTTTYVSSTQLKATIPAADIAAAWIAMVSVFNPGPGGGTSGARAFLINNPVPNMSGMSPAAAIAGGAGFTLTVNGTGFINNSVVVWKGSSRTTTYVSSTQLTAAISAADIATAGTASVTVVNSSPGGGTSNAQVFTINPSPGPTIASLSPMYVMAGGAQFTLTVNGSSFMTDSVVRWNGSARATTYVSSTRLTATIPAADIATAWIGLITAINPTAGNATSNSRIVLISNPIPITTGLSPATANAGGAGFTLTVNGKDFVSGSVVLWKGSRRTTTYISSTQLTATISAADIAVAGTVPVTVSNTSPGGGISNAQGFTTN